MKERFTINKIGTESSNIRKAKLFPDTRTIAHARASTHASKFTFTIYHPCKIIVFSFFVLLLLLYISRKEKFFIEGFVTEDYIKEI